MGVRTFGSETISGSECERRNHLATLYPHLQMEHLVKKNKEHVRHMVSNRTVDNVMKESSSIPALNVLSDAFVKDCNIRVPKFGSNANY